MRQPFEFCEIFSSDELRLFVDIGFVAISRGNSCAAAAVFEAVRLVRPKQEAGYIGGALACLAQGEAEAAIQFLRAGPKTAASRAFLGLALVLRGECGNGRSVLQSVVDLAPSTPLEELARGVLAEGGFEMTGRVPYRRGFV
ncbi:hypothetical protein SIAM614_00974 [Stappia aggregata IAM 12614]|uniref:Tetratricopeptide repeat protein n=1 Tax=Roseibium aggregatum (strain ATCC 25650 / DSM 13394 / JCM 20685 / NBRC 16684 / NCIMB 2208 / IAM 12614 / B1) TaxID=384765 RepID=A0P0K5_ROSAI|nr:hypothetical protein SIAM614_00974 [Stappia aggregata IAM 12614] [Roseibium aggregatum IAM 12614]